MAASDSSAIQKRDVVALDTTEHAKRMEAMRDLIKRTVCPKGITDDEFDLFVEQCKRSGFDPLMKEAFCVPRRQNIGTRERPNWVEKREFQASEAGMLSRAESLPDFRGVQASAVYAEDDILVDAEAGAVKHTFNPAKRKGLLVGAWAKVARENRLPVVVWLDFAGYAQQTPLWSSKPATMIEKCARVAALRKAYPKHFNGMYVAGERSDDVETGEDEPGAPVLSKPVMPATTATRDAIPTLERAPEKVPVVQFGGAAARDVVDAETVPSKPASVDGSAGYRLLQEAPAREPGQDDSDEEDPVKKDADDVCAKAKDVKTLEEYRALAPRSERFAKGTDERKRVNAALREAHGRITSGGKTNG